MAEFTVAEALKLPAFKRVKVVAGRGGLGRRIQTVNVMEVPDIKAFVRADELLLTTGFPIKDQPGLLRTLVPTLVDQGLAGLAVKLNRYLEALPKELLAAADRLAFPVLELPPDASFNDYINPLLSEILNRQAVMLQRSEGIYQRFTRVLLGGGGFKEIAFALADLTGARVVLYEGQRSLVPSVETPEAAHLPVLSTLFDLRRQNRSIEIEGFGYLLHLEPVLVGGDVPGHVTLWGFEAADEIDRRAVQHAATVFGLEFQRQMGLREMGRRFTSQFLIELFQGRLTDRREVVTRAGMLSLPLERMDAHLAIHVEGLNPVSTVEWHHRLGGHLNVMRRLFSVMDDVCRSEGVEHISFEHEGVFHLLFTPQSREPAEAGRLARRLAERVVKAFNVRYGDFRPVAGIGRYYGDFMRLPDAYREALHAIEAVNRMPGRVVEFAELGLSRVLVGTPPEQLDQFVEDLLGPLLRYDAEHGARWTWTLEMYLQTGGVVKETADRLHLHYNSLRYRLDRIEAVLGRSLKDPGYRLALYAALEARKMLARPLPRS